MVFRNDRLFRQIERLASSIATVRCQSTANGIAVEPTCPDGLPVSVFKMDGRQTLCIGNWYDDVDDDALVLSLVERALCGQLRLRLESDGQKFHTFTVEVHERPGKWIEVGQMATGHWLRSRTSRRVKYLCNEDFGQHAH